MADDFCLSIKRVLRKIPRGRIATYGLVAAMAGNPRGARQVVRVLHSSAEKERLPWHRVINVQGRISLPHGAGYELQKALLKREGVQFDRTDRVDFSRFLWSTPARPSHGKSPRNR